MDTSNFLKKIIYSQKLQSYHSPTPYSPSTAAHKYPSVGREENEAVHALRALDSGQLEPSVFGRRYLRLFIDWNNQHNAQFRREALHPLRGGTG
jgi:hypothetical protein